MQDNDEPELDLDEDEVKLCAQCRRRLALGVDVFTMESGVIGPRGIVPLEPPRLFCDLQCLRQYLAEENVEPTPLRRRVP